MQRYASSAGDTAPAPANWERREAKEGKEGTRECESMERKAREARVGLLVER